MKFESMIMPASSIVALDFKTLDVEVEERIEAVRERYRALAFAHKKMNSYKLTSQFLDMPRQSSPKPRLQHGKKHARLSFPFL